MNLTKTTIDGLVILQPTIFKDNRGTFIESFNKKNIKNLLGNINFIQENQSESCKGVIRGLHFQKPPFTQSKLVHCLSGTILDVALDLRKDSNTYGSYEKTILSNENKKQLFIPKGFAHGFIVLSEFAVVAYKVDNYYNSDSESGILWNDPDLNIDWIIKETEIIISKKDIKLPVFNNFISPF